MTAIPTDLIDIRPDARAVDETAVSAIANSIAEIGLINPIRVRSNGDRWEVIAGVHRLLAYRQLGLADIECFVAHDDDVIAEIAMIDENLCRADLSPSQRARLTARRKELYLIRHPETEHGAVGRAGYEEKSGQLVHSFAEATAASTGKDARTVRRDAERGEKVIPEVLDMIAGTPLDTGVFLDKIKSFPPNDQYRVAERELALLRSRERDKKREAKSAKIQADVKARAAREAAEIIAEHVPGEWWDNLKANLYAAGAKHVADALTNITGESVMDRSAA